MTTAPLQEQLATHLAIHVDDTAGLDDDRLYALQERLARGGTLDITTPRLDRRQATRLATRLGHWFEGAATTANARFPAVSPQQEGDRTLYRLRRTGGANVLGHFEHLAHDYADELPAHVVAHYRDRKLDQIAAAMPAHTGHRILDLGCGVGLYAHAAAERFGGPVFAVDASPQSVRAARARGAGDAVHFAAADALHLPFPDGTFDAVYTINVLHHLKRGDQARMLKEAARVLAPRGVLILLEVNTRNPLFSWYMRRVFPRRHRIDRGDEEFVLPRDLPVPPTLRLDRARAFTFLPDFLPRPILRALGPIERLIEATPARALGIHYAAILHRTEARI